MIYTWLEWYQRTTSSFSNEPSVLTAGLSVQQFSDEHSSITAILVAGLRNVPCAVLTSTVRTTPSEPGYTMVTLPRGQWPLAVFSAMRTTSPTCKFLMGCRYSSLVPLFQIWSVKTCVCLHLFRLETFLSTITFGGRFGHPFLTRKWFGVRASGSEILSLTWVIGRLFSRTSTSAITVPSTSC